MNPSGSQSEFPRALPKEQLCPFERSPPDLSMWPSLLNPQNCSQFRCWRWWRCSDFGRPSPGASDHAFSASGGHYQRAVVVHSHSAPRVRARLGGHPVGRRYPATRRPRHALSAGPRRLAGHRHPAVRDFPAGRRLPGVGQARAHRPLQVEGRVERPGPGGAGRALQQRGIRRGAGRSGGGHRSPVAGVGAIRRARRMAEPVPGDLQPAAGAAARWLEAAAGGAHSHGGLYGDLAIRLHAADRGRFGLRFRPLDGWVGLLGNADDSGGVAVVWRTIREGDRTMASLDWSQCPAVESFPGKVSGAWVLRGTRMPVAASFENIEAGAHIDDIMEWFDGLDREHVEAVIEFAVHSLDKEPAYAP